MSRSSGFGAGYRPAEQIAADLLATRRHVPSIDAAVFALPKADRIALARALVADMPGVVVAKVPDKRSPSAFGEPDYFRATGWNAAISAIITAGSATDV